MAPRKKTKTRTSTSQLMKFLPDSYLDRTSRPIYALIYLLGFIVFYELGTILINPEALHRSLESLQGRVVAFLWVQSLLNFIGFSGRAMWIATPSVVVIILIALQITSKTRCVRSGRLNNSRTTGVDNVMICTGSAFSPRSPQTPGPPSLRGENAGFRSRRLHWRPWRRHP